MARIIIVALIVTGAFLLGRVTAPAPATAPPPAAAPAAAPAFPGDLDGLPAGEHESFYRDRWAKHCGGDTEVVQPDGTRVDVQTDTHAIEIERAARWRDGIGQALAYGLQSNRRPALVLIIGDNEYRHYVALNSVVDHFRIPIDTAMIRTQ